MVASLLNSLFIFFLILVLFCWDHELALFFFFSFLSFLFFFESAHDPSIGYLQGNFSQEYEWSFYSETMIIGMEPNKVDA